MTSLGERFARQRQRVFVRALGQTMGLLFPFALVGAICQLVVHSLLNPDGFLYAVGYLDYWLSDAALTTLAGAVAALKGVTLGAMGLYAAYAMGKYTARSYRRDDQLAGLTALAATLLLSYRLGKGGGGNFSWLYISYGNLLLALLVGYLTGLAFRWLGQPGRPQAEPAAIGRSTRLAGDLLPVCLVLLLGLIGDVALNLAAYFSLFSQLTAGLQSLGGGDVPVWLKLVVILVTSLLNWLGVSGPEALGQLDLDGGQAASDLSTLLTHGSHAQLPYPYLVSTLQHSFANFGGPSLTLALLIALVIVMRQDHYQRLARLNLVPALFNSDAGLMVGLPVILNPLFLLPVISLPFVNLALACGAIALHLFPTPVYPVPTGTPGILTAFYGTNGNWVALAFTLGLLAIDVVGYLPFVKLACRLNHASGEVTSDEN